MLKELLTRENKTRWCGRRGGGKRGRATGGGDKAVAGPGWKLQPDVVLVGESRPASPRPPTRLPTHRPTTASPPARIISIKSGAGYVHPAEGKGREEGKGRSPTRGQEEGGEAAVPTCLPWSTLRGSSSSSSSPRRRREGGGGRRRRDSSPDRFRHTGFLASHGAPLLFTRGGASPG